MIDEYVRRLVSIGVPYSEAFGLCYDYYRRGDLPGYVADREDQYRRMCAGYVAEIID